MNQTMQNSNDASTKVNIPPALAPEEWSRFQRSAGWSVLGTVFLAGLLEAERPAGAAAALLQEAGPDGGPLFTAEDVRALRDELEDEWEGIDLAAFPKARRLFSLVDRLASILPPEATP